MVLIYLSLKFNFVLMNSDLYWIKKLDIIIFKFLIKQIHCNLTKI